jgi:hypothetical protein
MTSAHHELQVAACMHTHRLLDFVYDLPELHVITGLFAGRDVVSQEVTEDDIKGVISLLHGALYPRLHVAIAAQSALKASKYKCFRVYAHRSGFAMAKFDLRTVTEVAN